MFRQALSFDKDAWNHWSIDRIDNTKGHAKGNVFVEPSIHKELVGPVFGNGFNIKLTCQ